MKKFRFKPEKHQLITTAFQKLGDSTLKSISQRLLGGSKIYATHGQGFAKGPQSGHSESHSQTAECD